MIKINYIKPNQEETPDEVSIYNMTLSDKFKNLQSFCQSSLAWLKNDSNRNYQDLEKLLRELNLDTHLIAKKFKLEDYPDSSNYKLCIPNRVEQPSYLEFVLLVSCRSKADALKELNLHSSSYDENYTNLLKTGCFVDNSLSDRVVEFSYSALDNTNENLVLSSQMKYDFIQVTGKEAVEVIIKDLTKKYEKEPEQKVCGKLGDKDIFGLVLNGEIASPIGWVIHDDIYQLIDFRMIKKIKQNE